VAVGGSSGEPLSKDALSSAGPDARRGLRWIVSAIRSTTRSAKGA